MVGFRKPGNLLTRFPTFKYNYHLNSPLPAFIIDKSHRSDAASTAVKNNEDSKSFNVLWYFVKKKAQTQSEEVA